MASAPDNILAAPIFQRPNCKMRDPKNVEKLINMMRKAGLPKVHILTDFDFTLTRNYTRDGQAVPTSFEMFEKCPSLPPKYLEGTRELTRIYRPLERDPNLSLEEKERYMIKWWHEAGELLKGFEFDTAEIDTVTGDLAHSLRDRVPELFAVLNDLNVPLLVFSAGLGDCVVSVIKQAQLMHPNVKIVSNLVQYKDGLVNGFQEPIIHAFNKNETALEGTEYYDMIRKRDHIIVMGDSLGDAKMAEGVSTSAQVLKIGFLYYHAKENLNDYMNAFDIVLVDDQTMDVPLALIDIIRGK